MLNPLTILFSKKTTPVTKIPHMIDVDRLPGEALRIAKALSVHEEERRVSVENLDYVNDDQLRQEIEKANGALFHCSANCALLSTVVMYNLLNQHGAVLSAENTEPMFKAVNPSFAEIVIANTAFHAGNEDKIKSIDELESKILECYKKTGQKVFTASATGYQIPLIGESGHSFNALIRLNEIREPYVQFIDTWKTSNPMPTKADLVYHYSKDAEFNFAYCNKPEALPDFSVNSLAAKADPLLASPSKIPIVTHRPEPPQLKAETLKHQSEMKAKLLDIRQNTVDEQIESQAEEDSTYSPTLPK